MLDSPLFRQAALAVSVGVLLVTAALGQSKGTIIHSFGFHKGEGGETPYSNLIFDSAGNMYGTTIDGGTGWNNGYGNGVAFELSPKAGGGWSYRVICEFGSAQCPVGIAPFGGLVMDKSGNLFGTTDGGFDAGTGTVYELSPSSDGHWTSKLLYSFPAYPGDGTVPLAGVILDSAGNLYGTTSSGGAGDFGYGGGTVFELSPSSDGQWKETILYDFQGGNDGVGPASPLLFDDQGNLHGTAGGGSHGDGTIFELSRSAGGAWTEATLHAFDGLDGANPYAGLTSDSSGRLYGTTTNGGTSANCQNGCGTVFRLSPNESGTWSLVTLHDFSGGSDGADPYAGLAIDGSGTLYGATVSGGPGGCGTIFGLRKSGAKAFETVSFDGKNGCQPYSAVTLDGAGNIFGTASEGGVYGYGVVFELFNSQK